MVEEALRLGYRHIDTAEMYENEREVGEGLCASGVLREDVFITTKVWSSNLAPDDLARSARQSVAKLNVRQVDLLLIHWPNPRIPLAQTIPALCKAKTDGLARHIGVSNFDTKPVNEAVRLATEPLVNDQIEWHRSSINQQRARPATSMVSPSRPTVRWPRAAPPTTRRSPPSARVTARPRPRSHCASCCKRAQS